MVKNFTLVYFNRFFCLFAITNPKFCRQEILASKCFWSKMVILRIKFRSKFVVKQFDRKNIPRENLGKIIRMKSRFFNFLFVHYIPFF